MTVLSVFSSLIPGTFLVTRTVDATAILFKEADTFFSSKQSFYPTSHGRSCTKTIIPLGKAKRRLTPLLNKITKVTRPISALKSKIYEKLGISCVFPRILRPYQPLIERLSCKLGLDEGDNNEGFVQMSTFSCDSDNICREPSFENKVITRSHRLPNLDSAIPNQINTYDDCFQDIEKVTYGSRVIATLVNDSSCEDPRYQGICQELFTQKQILFEDDCRSVG